MWLASLLETRHKVAQRTARFLYHFLFGGHMNHLFYNPDVTQGFRLRGDGGAA